MTIRWKNIEQEWRRQLLADARGNILEVGVGAGINFKYYPVGARITATDFSAKAIGKAKAEAEANAVQSTFIVSPVEKLLLPPHSFDTIVSTFSLSAYQDPASALDQFNTWCKPGGEILLLEYGLSRYEVVNWLQRKWEPYHYRRTGSHIDRDMLAIISASGLGIKRVEVRYAGIVYLVWASLRPKSNDELIKVGFHN